MIDALAILIDQGCIDPTKYIEMECGIQHRCKDELFSSLIRSLNASQTSLFPVSLFYTCSFAKKLFVFIISVYTPMLRVLWKQSHFLNLFENWEACLVVDSV